MAVIKPDKKQYINNNVLDTFKLVKYFDKYSIFLKKNSFNSFLNGVINLEI